MSLSNSRSLLLENLHVQTSGDLFSWRAALGKKIIENSHIAFVYIFLFLHMPLVQNQEDGSENEYLPGSIPLVLIGVVPLIPRRVVAVVLCIFP
jgi:hypothetical protein